MSVDFNQRHLTSGDSSGIRMISDDQLKKAKGIFANIRAACFRAAGMKIELHGKMYIVNKRSLQKFLKQNPPQHESSTIKKFLKLPGKVQNQLAEKTTKLLLDLEQNPDLFQTMDKWNTQTLSEMKLSFFMHKQGDSHSITYSKADFENAIKQCTNPERKQTLEKIKKTLESESEKIIEALFTTQQYRTHVDKLSILICSDWRPSPEKKMSFINEQNNNNRPIVTQHPLLEQAKVLHEENQNNKILKEIITNLEKNQIPSDLQARRSKYLTNIFRNYLDAENKVNQLRSLFFETTPPQLIFSKRDFETIAQLPADDSVRVTSTSAKSLLEDFQGTMITKLATTETLNTLEESDLQLLETFLSSDWGETVENKDSILENIKTQLEKKNN